jgi:hypothetical protein
LKEEVNMNSLRSYLGFWTNLSYEGFNINLTEHMIDSIANTIPYLILEVQGKDGAKKSLTIHRKGIQRDSYVQYDRNGKPLEFEEE